jgi:hypothetical protein
MTPCWFAQAAIPYEHMWPDDKDWLPLLLAGKHFDGTFWFAPDGSVERQELRAHEIMSAAARTH